MQETRSDPRPDPKPEPLRKAGDNNRKCQHRVKASTAETQRKSRRMVTIDKRNSGFLCGLCGKMILTTETLCTQRKADKILSMVVAPIKTARSKT